MFADEDWFNRERALVDAFQGEVITVAENAHGTRCKVMSRGDLWGLATDPTTLNGASTVVHFAMNACVHLGVARIVLMGVELAYPAGGPARWHDRNPVPGRDVNFTKMRIAFETTVAPLRAMGIDVVNCTPGGSLDLWPRRALADVLREEDAHAVR